jgi:hypothetical protein
MGRFRIDAEVRWRKDSESGTQGNIPIEGFVPGDGSGKVRSEQAKTIGDLLTLSEMANGARMLTISLKAAHASLYLKPQWSIESVSLGICNAARLVVRARCSSPTRGNDKSPNGSPRTTLSFHDNPNGFVASKT